MTRASVQPPSTANEPGGQALAELLARCAEGDEQALGRLYAQASPKLFAVAVRIVKREDWAEDVLQETFVKIWRRAGDYRTERGAPMTWMASIARNGALDRLRREPGPDRHADGVDPEQAMGADPGPGPLDQLASGGDAARLTRCLETLGADQRQAIRLAYYDGLTHSELATRLGTPMGTIKSWIRRGLERLRDCLSR